MSAAELYKAKLDLIAWINQLSDVKMIEFLEGLRASEMKTDGWDDLPESHKARIEKGLEAMERGEVLSSEEFWKRLKNAR
jgi:predicted transcriptional regulator